MIIGNLDQRGRFERTEVTKDPVYNTDVVSWIPVATVWMNVKDALPSKSESQANGLSMSQNPARIRTRYMDGLTSAMRVVLIDRGNRVMTLVAGPAELGRREGMEFMAVQYSTAGDNP